MEQISQSVATVSPSRCLYAPPFSPDTRLPKNPGERLVGQDSQKCWMHVLRKIRGLDSKQL